MGPTERYNAFNEEAREVTSGGRVPVILSASDRPGLTKLKRALGRLSRSAVEDLPLVNGVSTWIGKNQIEQLFHKRSV